MKSISHFQTIEEFETLRLIAKRIQPQDSQLILPMYKSIAVMKYLGGIFSDDAALQAFSKILEQWNNYHFGFYCWFEKDSNQFIGRGGLRYAEIQKQTVVELGYALLPEFWNKGYATEIAAACVEIAFEKLHLKEIFYRTEVNNAPSLRVMKKMGFSILGDYNDGEGSHTLGILKQF